MDIKQKLASALYKARHEHNLTQEQIAELCDISVRWYQKIEKGESPPNLTLICLLVKHLNIDLAKIADREAYK